MDQLEDDLELQDELDLLKDEDEEDEENHTRPSALELEVLEETCIQTIIVLGRKAGCLKPLIDLEPLQRQETSTSTASTQHEKLQSGGDSRRHLGTRAPSRRAL